MDDGVSTSRRTSVNNVSCMEVVDGFQDLPDGLRAVFFGEATFFADPIEEFSTRSQLRNNIVFILKARVSPVSATVLEAN